MKRPLSVFGFSLFTVLLCLSPLEDIKVTLICAVAGCALFLLSVIIKKSRQSLFIPTAAAGIAIGCLLLLCFNCRYAQHISFCGEAVKIEGSISEAPQFSQENRRFTTVIRISKLNESNVRGYMKLTFSEPQDNIDHNSLSVGDRVSLRATVYPAGRTSESYKQYYRGLGIYLGAYGCSQLTVTPRKTIGTLMEQLRQWVKERLVFAFEEDVAAFAIAVITGDKSFLREEVYEQLRKSGIVHIMAVSGMHLTVWVAFLGSLTDFTHKKKRLYAVLMLMFTVFMMSFACFTGSVRRAGAMTALYFTAQLLSKRSDSLNSLGFAVICALTVNPFAVRDLSLLLSVLATLGIILVGIPLGKKLSARLAEGTAPIFSVIKAALTSFSLSLSAVVFTLPVSVIYFGGISLIAPLTNMLIFIAVAPTMVLTGLYCLFSPLPFVSEGIGYGVKYFSEYILTVSDKAARLPLSFINTEFYNLKYFVLTAFVFLMLSYILYRIDRVFSRLSLILSAGIFITGMLFSFHQSLTVPRIALFPSEGKCAVISYGGECAVAGLEGDSYARKDVKDYIEAMDLDIVAVFPFTGHQSSQLSALCRETDSQVKSTEGALSVQLSETLTLERRGECIIADTGSLKAEIFYKEYLQDDSTYATIDYTENCKEGEISFSLKKESPYRIIIRGDSLRSGGESAWQNLMKKVLRHT